MRRLTPSIVFRMKRLHRLLGLMLVITLLACNSGGRYDDDDDNGGDNGTGAIGFQLSGTIGVSNNSAVDSDTNDEFATTAPNDNFGLAQELPVPVVLGGYVNQPRAGADGNSFEFGDPSDFFRLSFSGGETIFLSFSEAAANDIHLYLYDDQRQLVDASRDDSHSQFLGVDTAGTYYVEVFAEAGAGNYTLSVNLAEFSSASPGGTGLRLSGDFVPGEALLDLEAARTTAMEMTALGITVSPTPGPQLVRFDVGGTALKAPSPLSSSRRPSAHRDRIAADNHALLAKWDTLEMVRHLRGQVGIGAVELNHRRYALGLTPDDTYIDRQWHYALINLSNAWAETTGSGDVIVAVIDTGVLLAHPDLQGKLVAGYDFIDDVDAANDGDGEDDNPDDPGDSLLENSSFHGTHVAGTIAALSDNGVGVAGAGWRTRVMPLRALGIGGGTTNDVIQAIRYAAGLRNTTGLTPERAADIINLSLGGEAYSAMEQAAVEAARDAGVIVVAAAGNSGDTTISYPAGYDGVVSVAAVDSLAELAPYSSYGDTVDVAAPGGDTQGDTDGDGYPDGVLSTCGEETGDAEFPVNMIYCFQQGTSMAAPHVAGVAALMKALDPDMTPDQFDARLMDGLLTRDIGESGRDDLFGYGLIDAYRSVLSALESAPTVALFSPAALNFGRSDTTLILSVSRLGEDDLSVTSIDSNADWLTAAAQDVDADGFGTYLVRVNRDGLVDGVYRTELAVTTSTGSRAIDASMQVLAESTPGELANHYVLLIDSASGEVVGQGDAGETTGAYTVDEVSAGTYYLIAGTDMDNDNFIGDAGEAFGAYLSLDDPVELAVDTSVSGLDMTTVFRLALPDTLPASMDRLGSGGYPLPPGAKTANRSPGAD